MTDVDRIIPAVLRVPMSYWRVAKRYFAKNPSSE